jgi:quercetin dioxygenase-like cupin family protein
MLSILASLVTLFLLPICTTAVDQDADPTLVANEKNANTWLDIANTDLPTDSDWFYDHNKNDKYTFDPGSVTNANCATFPAICGHGLTVALLNLGPCSMLPPHSHPRAANAVVAVSGSTTTYMIQENGARMVTETLTPGQMTIFPRGSMHTMVNNGESHLILCRSSERVPCRDVPKSRSRTNE